jgi:hypothetical protein
MKVALRWLLCGLLSMAVKTAYAQDQDAEGCKDSAMITRMPGSTIHSCDNKEFEQVKMPLGNDKAGNPKEKTVEGEYHSWDYGTREGVSAIQVFRNFEAALEKAGFTLDYEDSPGNRPKDLVQPSRSPTMVQKTAAQRTEESSWSRCRQLFGQTMKKARFRRALCFQLKYIR